MRAFFLFLVLLIFFLLFPTIAKTQADLVLSTAEIEIAEEGSYEFRIPPSIDTLIYPQISFNFQGADGGRARSASVWRNAVIARGGGGVLGSVTFNLGTGLRKLSPGGRLRFIVGQKGSNCGGPKNACGGGGGGGTAILYRHPGATVPVDNAPPTNSFTDENGGDARFNNWIL
ncbi:MAG: hypothetical protein AAF840_05250, partial [Bacteroidota bacterium]